jgi:hypothetical protein
MVRRVANIDTIDRKACREYAKKRFVARRMAEDYARLYAQLATNSQEVTGKLQRFVQKPSANTSKFVFRRPVKESL